jgi:tRNA modification GTPase
MNNVLSKNLFKRLGFPVYAAATAHGGPVVVVRVSGNNLDSLNGLTVDKSLPKPGTFQVKTIIDPATGDFIDKSLVLNFKSPNSFTGENVVEFHCHGVESIVEKLFQALQLCHVEAALPGEFSFRAVVNGKMTLEQAEALNVALGAESIKYEDASKLLGQAAKANQPFETSLKEATKDVQQMRGLLEAAIDFPEAAEEQNEFVETLQSRISRLKSKLSSLSSAIENFSARLKEPRIVIFGEPNVGKSTLFNILVGGERALVSSTAGTTRDVIEARVKWPRVGWVRILDTAGVRQTQDQIEILGIQKGKEFLDSASFGIWLKRKGQALDNQNKELQAWGAALESKGSVSTFVTFSNQSDLSSNPEALDLAQDKAESKKRVIDKLERQILDLAIPSDSVVYASQRQIDMVESGLELIHRIDFELNNSMPLEIVANSFRELERAFQGAKGVDLGDDYISELFSQFCLGK